MAMPRLLRTLSERDNVKAGALALGGMIVGAIVGIAVQVGVEATGVLGPSVDSLLAEQESNFEDVNARLDSLRTTAKDPAVQRELRQLAALVKKQDALRQQASSELEYLGGQVATLRQQALEEQGFAGGADLWLKTGESASIGDAHHVFGVVRMWAAAVDVNLNGEKKRMAVGDMVNTDECTVFFKQAMKRDDGRMGFDVTCT